MGSRNNLKLFAMSFCMLLGMTNASSAQTTTLSPCASCNSNQDAINTALKKGGTVYLNAGTYTINAPITINTPNVILAGARGAHIKLVNQANWPTYRPLITIKASGVRITGFELDGNGPNNRTSNGDNCVCGREYYDLIYVDHVSNVEVDHMYLHDNWNDTFLVKGGSNIKFHDNVIRRPGHDIAANYGNSSNVSIVNNCMRTYCNSAIRAYSSRPVYAINNDIARETGYTGGYAAFEIQAENPQLYNCNNNVHNMKQVTAFLYGASSSNYHIGGCPISPAKAKHVDTCNPADIDSTDITSSGTTTTTTTDITTTTDTTTDTTTTTTTETTTSETTTTDSTNVPGTMITMGNVTILKPGEGTNHQELINSALVKGGTVYLTKGVYTIDQPINLHDNVRLGGDRGAIIKLASNVNWNANKPMISGTGLTNIRIAGFEIDGNKSGNTTSNGKTLVTGQDYYNLIYFNNSSNIEVDNMYLHDGFANAVMAKRVSKLNVHNNVIKNMGVDSVNAYRGGVTNVVNNCMQINHGGTRSDATTPMYVASNSIASVSGATSTGGIIIEDEGHISMRVYNCSNTNAVNPQIGYMTGGASSMLRAGGCPSIPALATATSSCSPTDLKTLAAADLSALDAGSEATSDTSTADTTSTQGTGSNTGTTTTTTTTGTTTTGSDIGTVTTSGSTTTLTPCASCTSNQTAINAALKKGGTVYLKAGTYTIDSTINLVSNTTLTGDRGAKIMLKANANWPQRKPMLLGSSVSNVRIHGFEIDGNRDANTSSGGNATKCGKYYYDMIQLSGSSNIEIDHMYLHHNWNDIVLSKTTKNLNFHNNIVRQPGHDIVSIYNSGTTYATNNCLRLYCNSALRAAGGGGPLYGINNDIARDTGAGGYGGFEVQTNATMYDCNNNIHNVATKYANLGGSIHSGGCPISPAKALIVDSCNPADIDKD